MNTELFITRLVEISTPVRPLAPPRWRTICWAALALPYVALVVFVVAPRGDLATKLVDANYAVEISAAFATGLTAAFAAFATAVPGHNRRIASLPLFPLAIWLGSLGHGCIQTLIGPDGLSIHPDWFCVPAIVLVGAIPAIAMALMLRRGAPLKPHLTAALGGLAAAGLGDFGLRLFHEQDASLVVLIWQFGTVFMLTILAALAGQYLLNWRSIIEASHFQAALLATEHSHWS